MHACIKSTMIDIAGKEGDLTDVEVHRVHREADDVALGKSDLED